jgi:hypothetical protein
MNLVADIANWQTWTLQGVIIAAVILVAAVAVLIVVIKACKIEIPEWVTHIVWICAVAFVAVVALKFIFSL